MVAPENELESILETEAQVNPQMHADQRND